VAFFVVKRKIVSYSLILTDYDLRKCGIIEKQELASVEFFHDTKR
jgi:hypothetical protein